MIFMSEEHLQSAHIMKFTLCSFEYSTGLNVNFCKTKRCYFGHAKYATHGRKAK